MHNIFLVGLPACGKSSVGKRLAQQLNLPFYDTDKEIEAHCGCSINQLFEMQGETYFRAAETAILNKLSQFKGLVLATGGGIILAPENRAMLKSRGIVIYLEVNIETQLKRLSHDRSRPLLQGVDKAKKLEELKQVRHALYLETAHHVVNSDDKKPVATVEKIMSVLT